jgi:hypothetical protein
LRPVRDSSRPSRRVEWCYCHVSPMRRDGRGATVTVICDNCGGEAPRVWNDVSLPIAGMTFNNDSLGYYAGFFDCYPPEENWLSICHDCAVTFMKTMSGLASKLLPMRGGHPNENFESDAPCCAWAWKWDEEVPCSDCGAATVLLGTHDLTWEVRPCPCPK